MLYVEPASFLHSSPRTCPRGRRGHGGSQRPAAFAALVHPLGTARLDHDPSWYLRASQDSLIPPAAQRAMAERAGWTTARSAALMSP